MNNRQRRLCRALLDFYDASGAQPCPLAQLAKKTGYHASDIYDKDSQSGDLWPFDPRARGNLAGMLSFTSGKNPTVNITAAGLVALENLCKESPAVVPAPAASPILASPARVEKEIETPKPVIPSSKGYSSEEIAAARGRFLVWLKSDQAKKTLLDDLNGDELIEAAFEKFFGEFL